MKVEGGVERYLFSFSTSALNGVGWPTPLPGRFAPGKKHTFIEYVARWNPELFWRTWRIKKNLFLLLGFEPRVLP
jgi:hypothetical protein